MIHVDLHETTDSDETEFMPAKASRDGEYIAPDVIPDGFYREPRKDCLLSRQEHAFQV